MTVLDLDSIPYFPAKNQRATRRLGGANGSLADSPRVIVVHTMESAMAPGVAMGNAIWQRDTGNNGVDVVSSHLAIDPTTIIRCVRDDDTAFTQSTPWNDMSLSIEQSGRAAYTADQWTSGDGARQVELVAQACAAWCVKWGIPARFVAGDELARTWRFCSGITTHYQITLASQTPAMKALGYKPGSHTDPGAAYPMEALIARVKALIAKPEPVPPPDEDDMPTEIKLIDSQGTHFVWNPPTNTLRWVNDGNVASIEPESAFAVIHQGNLPNGNPVDDGLRSLIVNTVKAGVAPNAGQFQGAW